MTRTLIEAAVALADTLRRENLALAALDMAGAVRLLAEKQAATDRFMAAQGAASATGARLAEDRALLRQVAGALARQASENRLLLERAMLVQSRVLGALAQAVPRALATTQHYTAAGAMRGTRRLPAVALSARA